MADVISRKKQTWSEMVNENDSVERCKKRHLGGLLKSTWSLKPEFVCAQLSKQLIVKRYLCECKVYFGEALLLFIHILNVYLHNI